MTSFFEFALQGLVYDHGYERIAKVKRLHFQLSQIHHFPFKLDLGHLMQKMIDNDF
jgi:hypothetical protein